MFPTDLGYEFHAFKSLLTTCNMRAYLCRAIVVTCSIDYYCVLTCSAIFSAVYLSGTDIEFAFE